MNMDRSYIEPVFTLSLCDVYALNVAIALSDWTPNGEIFGIHKLPVNPKDSPNISAPRM